MANNDKQSSKDVAHLAAETLNNPNASAIQKSLAVRCYHKQEQKNQTGANMEAKASAALKNPRSSEVTKTLAVRLFLNRIKSAKKKAGLTRLSCFQLSLFAQVVPDSAVESCVWMRSRRLERLHSSLRANADMLIIASSPCHLESTASAACCQYRSKLISYVSPFLCLQQPKVSRNSESASHR